MKKALALLVLAVVACLCSWYGGANAERNRTKAAFSNTQATVVVHCGPVNPHDLAAREKYFPVLKDPERLEKAFETAYDLDGYVMVLGDCEWPPKSWQSSDYAVLRRYP